MRHYCTYADHNYLPRALALADSLEQGGDYALWLLALSQECEDILARLQHPRIKAVPLRTLEEFDAELAATKAGRTGAEYIFTLTPCWMSYLFQTQPDVSLLTYLDSDLFFFASPEPIYAEMGGASIAIIEHRYAKPSDRAELFGRFNVGWVSFRRDENGLGCVARWRQQCIEWCHETPENGRYADQGYLNDWPETFTGVHVIQHHGANTAPWNVERYELTKNGSRLFVDSEEVIFYHFSSMWRKHPYFVRTGLEDYEINVPLRQKLSRWAYRPYLDAVVAATRRLSAAGFTGSSINYSRYTNFDSFAGWDQSSFLTRWQTRLFGFLKERRDGRLLLCLL